MSVVMQNLLGQVSQRPRLHFGVLQVVSEDEANSKRYLGNLYLDQGDKHCPEVSPENRALASAVWWHDNYTQLICSHQHRS